MNNADLKQAIEILENFNAKIEELRNESRFTKWVYKNCLAPKFLLPKRRGIKLIFSPKKYLKNFILAYRFFIQNTDGISVVRLKKIYDKLPVINLQKQKFYKERNALTKLLSEEASFKINGCKVITNREILDAVIYGKFVHEKEKLKQYDKWCIDTFIEKKILKHFCNILHIHYLYLNNIRSINESTIREIKRFITSKFAVISPTHIDGKKPEAWENFKNGRYVAMVSRIKEDLSNKSIDEILEKVRSIPRYRGTELVRRLREYPAFFSLRKGDYVAVNNTNAGLFGIGKIKGGYKFLKSGHNTGSSNPDDFYCHFYPVKWIDTSYRRKRDIIFSGEKGWPPRGIISLFLEVPAYINRILKKSSG